MTLIVALRYLVVSGGFWLVGQRRFPALHRGKQAQVRGEIAWSLSGVAIYALPAAAAMLAWQTYGLTLIYSDPSAYPPWWIPVSVLLVLAIQDTAFYWTHRAMHQPWLFQRMHAVHHSGRSPTPWAAMNFHPWEALSGAFILPLLVFVIPMHAGAVLTVLLIMTIMGTANHAGWELFPRWLVHGPVGKWVITATHHQRHHENYGCNYALYFRFWDRLCGTDRGFAELR